MPYKNIIFVKVKMELLEDPRFLVDLNDRQKCLYLLLICLAGKTENSIRNDFDFIKGRLNLRELEMSDLEHISKIFPKFKCSNGKWQFDNFEEIHNYTGGNSKGNPLELQRSCKNKNKIEKENKKQEIPYDDFIETLKKNKAYSHINLSLELSKMDAWLAAHPGRKKTHRFVVNWLNKIEAPLPEEKKPSVYDGLRKLVM